jgi:hypothetical protein
MGFDFVVAVDPGRVSPRVRYASSNHVVARHVPKRIQDLQPEDITAVRHRNREDSDSSVNDEHAVSSSKPLSPDSEPGPTIAAVVCDACILWADLMDDVLPRRLAPALAGQCRLPCMWTITLKLPFKSTGSIQRQVSQICDRIPMFVRDLALTLYGATAVAADIVKTNYKFLHLFANSSSERTLFVVFDMSKQDE